MANITKHAMKRSKSRLGLSKDGSEKNATRALINGISHSDTAGALNKYITSLYFKHKTANNVRIYCGSVYIFCNDVLITVFPLPQKFRKTVENIKRKKGCREQ